MRSNGNSLLLAVLHTISSTKVFGEAHVGQLALVGTTGCREKERQ